MNAEQNYLHAVQNIQELVNLLRSEAFLYKQLGDPDGDLNYTVSEFTDIRQRIFNYFYGVERAWVEQAIEERRHNEGNT